jgi:hypothetical protein
MSVQISVKTTGLNISANLRDDALSALIQLLQEFRDESATPPSPAADTSAGAGATPGVAVSGTLTGHSNEQAIKEFLKAHGAAELLNRLKWDSFPEKILLLGAWYESRGGGTPWRSADMDETFKQAKESPPRNFPRDIKNAIKSGWIHAETPRTYAVTRSGWNKIGQATENLAGQ